MAQHALRERSQATDVIDRILNPLGSGAGKKAEIRKRLAVLLADPSVAGKVKRGLGADRNGSVPLWARAEKVASENGNDSLR